jgi:Fe-S-cluster containining protein
MKKNGCNSCGTCCTYEILITLADIDRASKGLKIKPEKFMRIYLKRELSITYDLYLLAKKEENKCPFIDEDNLCMIHKFKPDVCRNFQCLKSYGNIKIDISENNKLPSQTKEGIATMEYIGKKGFKFVEE